MKVPGMIVAFRNDVQKALFDIELAGQISDGTGEASIPSYADVGTSSFWAERRAKLDGALRGANLTIEQLNAICTDKKLFDHKQLVRELRDMSKICRTERAAR